MRVTVTVYRHPNLPKVISGRAFSKISVWCKTHILHTLTIQNILLNEIFRNNKILKIRLWTLFDDGVGDYTFSNPRMLLSVPSRRRSLKNSYLKLILKFGGKNLKFLKRFILAFALFILFVLPWSLEETCTIVSKQTNAIKAFCIYI